MQKEKKETHEIYAGVYTLATVITVFLLELYSELENYIPTLFEVSGWIKYALNALIFIIHWAAFSCLFELLRYACLKWRKRRWRKKNSAYDIEGVWLHIHDKEDVKIGVVQIEQDFYNLSVYAENIVPEMAKGKKTRWHYIGSEFYPDENAPIRLLGCYFAQREDEASKQGIHLFREFHTKDGVVTKITGEFGDSIRTIHGQSPKLISDKTGKITLYRLSKELKEYIGFKSVDDYNVKI